MEEKEDVSKRPDDSAFKQQRLRAWQPLLTPPWVIGTFAFIGCLFLIIGGVVLSASRKVVEYEMRYDNNVNCPVNTLINNTNTLDINNTDGRCSVNFTVTSQMNSPIYFYYKLSNFYQNHRRYVKSRDDIQLSGEKAGSAEKSACEPLDKNENDGGKYYYPCGLIANSFFNDTFFGCFREGGNQSADCVPMSADSKTWIKDGIAWKSDKEKKFKSRAIQSSETRTSVSGFQLPDVGDEDFIVWMRTAGLPTFKKLHRKIEKTFYPGDTITVYYNNRYPVSGFDGEKAMVLSTTSWLGGKNDFLGYAYIVVGVICSLLAIAFGLKHYIAPRAMGDTAYLAWSAGGKPNAIKS